ncbi:MAG TPA: FlgD immunoglobulin-like domain containing protein [Candidatus Eisenbacteria bacterium]|nr:FlgD immunoglobulin-like domain containing protein [Candidatus Eisenbacteria bacterium]
MKRIGLITILGSVVLLVFSGASYATPQVTGASIETRTFNDCPLSVLTTSNNYPASIVITDEMDTLCVGFANLHSFSFSAGGDTAAVFDNNSNFHVAADVSITGEGEGEGGLRISPWYGKYTDGRFMLNATTGEIAAFGGALPFYSFTVNHGISYTKGTTVHLEITYLANDLTAANPATIQYRVVMNGTTYDSPVLPFGEQNPAECVHGLWGMLNDARVGGYFQPRANTGAPLAITWSNIQFAVLECAVACVDVEPPVVEVLLDRDSLWPPNHKLWEICATVNVSDDCDDNPVVSLLSVTSNEPDNGKGDGNTENDIQIQGDDCFLLRAERSGGGDGRVYSIIYCATDSAGHTACDTATVVVAHDQSGRALSSDGFAPDGRALLPQVERFTLVIPSASGFDARRVDASNVRIGNERGVIAPKNVQYADANKDGLVDLGLSYETNALTQLLQQGSTTAGLRYKVGNVPYVVPDIFQLGPPVALAGSTPVTRVVMPSQPNPFRLSTVIRYSVGDAPSHVQIAVFDPSGRRVRTLVNEMQGPGSHVATWDGRREDGTRAAAGVYFMKADVAGQQASERLILLK